ncbi:hypothetical protein D3C87_192000 [compost metagenome]
MEFSFKLYDFIQQIETNRHYMVMWAAFGVPAFMFALCLPLFIIRKVGLDKYIKGSYTVIFSSLGITWILGFITMMILFSTEVSGIRMFMVWVVMFVTYLTFCAFNNKMLSKWLTEFSKTDLKK